jgi:serine/threonine protein kinase
VKPSFDIWALGAILIEMFTRKHFKRIHADASEEERRRLMNDLQRNVDIPAEVNDDQAQHLICKMMQINALDRASILKVLVSTQLSPPLPFFFSYD